MKRRSFLQALGLAPVAGPLAAKAAADKAIADMAGVQIDGLRGGGGGYGPNVAPPRATASAADIDQFQAAAQYVKTFGLPKFAEAQLRENSRYVGGLDPDIAAKRSWSMSFKIVTQRQRNYEAALRRIEEAGWQSPARMAFNKVLGTWWPW